jgi:selenide, water dikinase
VIQSPVIKDLVFVGGGHAHALALKSFAMNPIPGVRLTLVTRDVETPYSGMLPGFVAGCYTFRDCHIDLCRLAAFAGARLIHAEATGLDRANARVLFNDRPGVAYDILSVDIGSTPRAGDFPGAAEHAIPVKPINTFGLRWTALLERAALSSRPLSQPLRLAVVGGGATGVELALSAQRRLADLFREKRRDPALVRVVLLARDGVLPTHNAGARRRIVRILARRGVEVLSGGPVAAVEPGALKLADGRVVEADEILWATQAGAAPWLGATGLALDENGFIKVNAALRSVNDPAVFAAGDIAAVVDHPRPKAGVFAVRQGAPLAGNLRKALRDEPLTPFIPQRRFLCLIGEGDGRAVAARGGWSAEGRWVWRMKDWIDRRFMRKFQDLPANGAAPLGQDAMRCGGCGAKVGADVLKRALARLDLAAQPGDGVLIGLDAPDDAAAVIPPPGMALVQTVDFFRAMISDPYLFGRIAANHALGDIYAMGARPHSALAVAVTPFARENKMEDDLYQMLAGALAVFREAGVSLIGGHSSEGAELALGFTVNGFAAPGGLLRKSGFASGDRLILTKPLGTGVIFAAGMRARAPAASMEAAIAMALQSNAEAARILIAHKASAMTDVTGFGLAGHLAEMLDAAEKSGAGGGARLDIDRIPALPGATSLFAQGFASSLQPQNLRQRRIIANLPEAEQHPLFPLLFDPQTAGGLLAATPENHAHACVEALRAAGYGAARLIGALTKTDGDNAPRKPASIICCHG